MLTEYIRHVINTLNIAGDVPDAGGVLVTHTASDHDLVRVMIFHMSDEKKHTEEEKRRE